MRIFYVAREPSAEIVRVESHSLWRRANLKARGPRTFCGDYACRIALAVAPCEFSTWPARIFYVAREPSAEIVRVGAPSLWRRAIFYVADKPSAEIVRVGAPSLWRRAIFLRGRRTLCGDCACRSALAVAPCEFSTWPANPLRRLCVSERPRCGAVRIFYVADKPSAEIVRVGAPSLWRRAIFLRGRRTLCGDCACRIALAVVFAKFNDKSSTRSTLPQLRPENRKF